MERKCGRNLRQSAQKARATLQQCNRATFAVRDLIERTLLRRFVFSPPNDSCAVTKTVAGEMIVRHFHHYFRIDRLPFAAAFGAPPTRAARGVSGETRWFAQGLEFLRQRALVRGLESGSEPDVM